MPIIDVTVILLLIVIAIIAYIVAAIVIHEHRKVMWTHWDPKTVVAKSDHQEGRQQLKKII